MPIASCPLPFWGFYMLTFTNFCDNKKTTHKAQNWKKLVEMFGIFQCFPFKSSRKIYLLRELLELCKWKFNFRKVLFIFLRSGRCTIFHENSLIFFMNENEETWKDFITDFDSGNNYLWFQSLVLKLKARFSGKPKVKVSKKKHYERWGIPPILLNLEKRKCFPHLLLITNNSSVNWQFL